MDEHNDGDGDDNKDKNLSSLYKKYTSTIFI